MSYMYARYGSRDAIVEASDTHVHIVEINASCIAVRDYKTFTGKQQIDILILVADLLGTNPKELDLDYTDTTLYCKVESDD